MEVDWDLQAVVRGCAMTNSSSVENPLSTFSTLTHEQEDHFSFPNPSENQTVLEELDELYKPFFPNFHSLSTQTIPTSISSSLEGFKEKKQQTIQLHQQKSLTGSSTSAPVFSHSQTPRSKKRKNQQKKVVCHVSAEGLSSDLWAWRKYGQKPIKGSPYPRGYYRCSSSKGCLARKQVEKSRSDSNMFIITYTAEHNHPVPTHRNSLAGSTRQKLSDTGADKTITKPSEDDLLLKTKKEEEEEEEEIVEEEEQIDELLMPNMVITEDLFMGTEQFAGPVFDDSFSDHFSANFSSIWATNKAETTTGLS